MYSISKLQAMPEQELKDIVDQMGIKKVNTADKDEMVYAILDQQAINAASTATERKRKMMQTLPSPDAVVRQKRCQKERSRQTR